MLDNQIPKHKKKSKVKGQPRSNHKHEYKQCILEDGRYLFVSSYCTICGKIGDRNMESVPVEGSSYNRLLSKEETREFHKNLEVKFVSNAIDDKFVSL